MRFDTQFCIHCFSICDKSPSHFLPAAVVTYLLTHRYITANIPQKIPCSQFIDTSTTSPHVTTPGYSPTSVPGGSSLVVCQNFSVYSQTRHSTWPSPKTGFQSSDSCAIILKADLSPRLMIIYERYHPPRFGDVTLLDVYMAILYVLGIHQRLHLFCTISVAAELS